eukprot:3054780-Amphidinium_carterae.1
MSVVSCHRSDGVERRRSHGNSCGHPRGPKLGLRKLPDMYLHLPHEVFSLEQRLHLAPHNMKHSWTCSGLSLQWNAPTLAITRTGHEVINELVCNDFGYHYEEGPKVICVAIYASMCSCGCGRWHSFQYMLGTPYPAPASNTTKAIQIQKPCALGGRAQN